MPSCTGGLTRSAEGFGVARALAGTAGGILTAIRAGAVAALDSLAEAKPDAPLLRDLGLLLAAERQLDTADPADLTRTLEPLAVAGAPWRNPARELLALAAIRAGELDKARPILQELSVEVGVPPSQQKRAAELLQAIGGTVPSAGS